MEEEFYGGLKWTCIDIGKNVIDYFVVDEVSGLREGVYYVKYRYVTVIREV